MEIEKSVSTADTMLEKKTPPRYTLFITQRGGLFNYPTKRFSSPVPLTSTKERRLSCSFWVNLKIHCLVQPLHPNIIQFLRRETS